MRILISNDDGIHAPGIRALVEAARSFGEVTVVAPDRQRSASSHGISLHHRLYVEEVDFHMSGVKAYSLSGTPVDCVKWAVTTLGTASKFDLMLSGINEGPNLATDVLYSGTLAAAGEAALQHIPAIAFSLMGPPYLYDEAAQVARQIVQALASIPFPPDTFVSVNFPPSRLLDAPWSVTQLGARSYKDEFFEETDEQGRVCYRYGGEAVDDVGGPDADVWAVQNGEISLTPLRYRFTNDEMIATLKAKLTRKDDGSR
jgi:5'-nucleotidase